jgi:hypothetical protein
MVVVIRAKRAMNVLWRPPRGVGLRSGYDVLAAGGAPPYCAVEAGYSGSTKAFADGDTKPLPDDRGHTGTSRRQRAVC